MKPLRKNYTHVAIVGVATMSLGFGAGFLSGKHLQKQEAAAAANSQEIQEARQNLEQLKLQFTPKSIYVKRAEEKIAMLEQRQKLR